MARKLLITECLQNDFVRPIGRYDPLPNLLHVGFKESLRLMGENPGEGPVAQMMNWAHSQPEHQLDVIHVRDWHDLLDPSQKSHLDYFGSHCLHDTEGAQFAFATSTHRTTKIVNALTLNDFLDGQLTRFLDEYAGQRVDVGLIGVWTEAKVMFLAYELTTRYPNFNLALCSALTASSSRAQHFIALNQMQKVLGVKIYESLGEFVDFLSASGTSKEIAPRKISHAQTLAIKSEHPLKGEAQELLCYLFRDCKSVQLKTLDGGFSGNLVVASQSIDQYGHTQVPHVVKMGPRKLIAAERTAFERIESVLGNSAPRIVDFADLETLGAIKYRYASMGGQASSFQKIYMRGEKLSRLKNVLTDVFREQLGRLYSAAEIESCNLLKYYSFRADLAERVHELALGAGGSKSEAEILSRFYQSHLPGMLQASENRYFSYVHGDLNGANIIVDGHDNTWLIDFFHTHRGHVLKDLSKLENDILYIYTPIKSESDLKHAETFSEQLLDVKDLWQAPAFKASELKLAQFKRAAAIIRHMRSFYKTLVQSDRDPYQLMVAQLRYAVHTLSFDECNKSQKRWALTTALILVNQIIECAQGTRKLHIDWVDVAESKREIGLTILPGRQDRSRDLAQDLKVIKAEGITDIVCLATPTELKHYGVGALLDIYKRHGLYVLPFPIPDGKAPQPHELKNLIAEMESGLKLGRKYLIHCVGGLGRSGLVAACFLKGRGMSTKDAIAVVRRQRSQRAIETALQEKFVGSYRTIRNRI